MIAYLLKRTIQILLTLFVFLTIVFFLVNAQPGDISNVYALNPDLPPETREKLRELFGVNQPLWKQYLVYLKNAVTGNFGVSFSLYPRTVADVIAERLPRTLVLFMTATVLSFYLGFVLGKIIAWRRGGWTEYASTLGGVTLYTVFTPWFGLMMIWLFAFKAGWFPIGKFLDPVVWQDAPTDANTVFNRMIITVTCIVRRRVCRLRGHDQAARERGVADTARQRRRVRRRAGGGVAGLGHGPPRLGHRQAYGPADSDVGLD